MPTMNWATLVLKEGEREGGKEEGREGGREGKG
jgi:hypothetical protein